MSAYLYPQRRADGTFSVAIRYTMLQQNAVQNVRDHVASWLQRKQAADRLDVSGEFLHLPYVEVLDQSVTQIVFDCVRTAVLWKGLMVELASELDSVGNIERLGFWDLVAGVVHPGSSAVAGGRPTT